MDFLFTALPDSNFQMNNKQLLLWQQNAMFECECDNFINKRIEIGRQGPQLFRNYAVDTAISYYGIQRRSRGTHRDDDISEGVDFNLHFPYRRIDNQSPHGLYYDLYREAISEAIRDQGLGLSRNLPF